MNLMRLHGLTCIEQADGFSLQHSKINQNMNQDISHNKFYDYKALIDRACDYTTENDSMVSFNYFKLSLILGNVNNYSLY
jgi:hypothetical protein